MFKTKDTISKITILIGMLVIGYSVFVYFESKDDYDNYEIISGKVVNYTKNSDGVNVPVIKYIIEKDTYELINHNEIGTYPKENRVHVEYNKDNPKEAKLYESYKNFGIPISIGTIGTMILTFGLIMLYFSWKKRSSYNDLA